MRVFHKLEGWNKDRDCARRSTTEEVLIKNGINFTCPSNGHFKIQCSCHTLMFYPKSGTIIWKVFKRSRQHKFVSDDEGKLVRKIKSISGEQLWQRMTNMLGLEDRV